MYETTNVNIPNILRGSQTTADFIRNWFNNTPFVNKHA